MTESSSTRFFPEPTARQPRFSIQMNLHDHSKQPVQIDDYLHRMEYQHHVYALRKKKSLKHALLSALSGVCMWVHNQ
jgi:hypothetical protein